MIDEGLFLSLKEKYGLVSSWAVWKNEITRPKENIGDLTIFDIKNNPYLLEQLNPHIIFVGLNFADRLVKEPFANFHDSSGKAQDFKIRYAIRNTHYYGGYMTDIIKNYHETKSKELLKFLQKNKSFEKENIAQFQREINDLKVKNPLIITFGFDTFRILSSYFSRIYRILSIPHYSSREANRKEEYRQRVCSILKVVNNHRS